MKKMCQVFLLLCASALYAGNLVDNGALESDQSITPDNWVISGDSFDYQRTGGPESKARVTAKDSETFSLSQHGITLVKGEKYRLSAMIKTVNFSYERALLVVNNDGWRADSGFRTFPENSDWKRISTVFTAPESRSGLYGLVFNLQRIQGEIAIADIKLEAITANGKENSFSPIGSIKERFLVPLEPSLARLPYDRKEITLLWPYSVTDKTFCEVEINGENLGKYNIENRQIRVPLKNIVEGKNKFSARIISAGKEEGKCEFTFGFSPVLSDAPEAKRLNNLVKELVNGNISKDKEVSFVNFRDGWIFFAVEADNEVALALNGDNIPLLNQVGNRREAMRRLKAGEYRIAVNSGTPVKLIVRAIPELFKYPSIYNSYVPDNGKYSWDFHKKYIFDACNVMNGHDIPQANRQEALDRGIEWFSNLNIRSDMVRLDSKALTEKIETSPRFTNPAQQGITMDEIFFSRSAGMLVKYATALRQLKNPDNKSIYTWYVGSPAIPGVHHDLISSSINVADGRGFMLFEAYCQPQDNEISAKAFIENKILTAIRQINAFIPDASSKLGIILGNFNQIPILSLDHRPDVDYKYYLDMQMNLLANNPDCIDLPVVGYWGCQYADEELLRWSFRLLRHYGIEGQTTMLSEQYGYKYQPDLLKNCDFTDGLTHWEAEGNVRSDSFKDFGKNNLKLWTGNIGNEFAVLQSGEKPASLSQSAEGLIPGKLYSLQFAVADLADVKENKVNPRRLPLSADIGNAEIIKDKSFVYVDKRKEAANTKFGRINLHRTVFRATAPEIRIQFSNNGKPDEELILSHVMLRPYFEN